jgi:hypothetical protein
MFWMTVDDLCGPCMTSHRAWARRGVSLVYSGKDINAMTRRAVDRRVGVRQARQGMQDQERLTRRGVVWN